MSRSNSEPPSRQAIIDYLDGQDGPVTLQGLAEEFGVPPDDDIGLRRRLGAMQRDGQILQNRKGGYLVVNRLDLVPGRVTGHRDGYGFLIPDDQSGDIYLSPREMQKVMHGDRVLVRRTGTDPRGRTEGAIVEVTARAHRQLVGRLINERGVLLVAPEDHRIKHDVMIQPGATMGAVPGQVVSVEITEPPSVNAPPIGRIVEVLGELDDPGMEIEIAVRKFDVPHIFPDEVLAEVAAVPDKLRPSDYRGRVDLRDVPLVTIDGEDARDFDDAVYCEPSGTGWRLLVAIADVSHYVTQPSATDAEAQARATSVYFPRRVIPMLPEKLSNGLCSLNPGVDRLVLVADMIVDAKGRTKAYQFYPAVMHSHARLTYDEVWGILSGGDPRATERHRDLVGDLNELHALFRRLLKARGERGAIDFDTTETQIICDPSGRIQSIVARTRNDAHRLIEECMLCANTCAADFLLRRKHPGLYRVHEGPTPERLARLRQFLSGLGLALSQGDADPTPKDYQQLSAKIAGRPDEALLQTMMLRSMQQAIYTPINSGHFGLAYDGYAHFTSPIRRYPDLLNHRAIKALLRGERYQPLVEQRGPDAQAAAAAAAAAAPKSRLTVKPAGKDEKPVPRGRGKAAANNPADEIAWEQLGNICSFNERRADDATRDVEAWLKCQYMRERVGEQYRGRITGVAPFGVFVTLEALYVEGMVHVSELGSEYFQYSDTSHELRGERTGIRYRLTDEIDVQVSRVDLEGRRIEFRLVERSAEQRGGEGPRPAGAGRDGDREGAEGRRRGGADASGKAGTTAAANGTGGKGGKDGAGGSAGTAKGGGTDRDDRGRHGRKAARPKTDQVNEARAARKARKLGKGGARLGASNSSGSTSGGARKPGKGSGRAGGGRKSRSR